MSVHDRVIRGFTLIEVMLAMLVLGFIGLAGASVFQQMAQSNRHIQAHQELLGQLQFTMLLLERDVRFMVARSQREAEKEHLYLTSNAQELLSDAGGLAFVRAGWSNPQAALPRSELQPVGYRVQEHQLQRFSLPFVNAVDREPVVQKLLDGIQGFEVSFLSKGQERAEWNRSGLPDAIRVRIEHDYFGELERLLLVGGETVHLEHSWTDEEQGDAHHER